MTNLSGQLHKMSAQLHDPVQYSFVLKESGATIGNLPAVNNFLGQQLALKFTGNIHCIGCQRKITKTYQQGYCYPCATKLAACDMCILKPHTCHFDKGTCREPDWSQSNCFIPHIVYLANSSGLKVGITKETQVPQRWIDQGAIQALPILRVQSRFQAGLLEYEFSKLISDKTDWRKMLRGHNEVIDLAAKRDELFAQLATKIQEVACKFKFGSIEMLTAESVYNFNYPVLEYPEKITTLDFDKNNTIDDILFGIKGQYLLFKSGVINLRKFTGYEIAIL
jgi:hypothetical protein